MALEKGSGEVQERGAGDTNANSFDSLIPEEGFICEEI